MTTLGWLLVILGALAVNAIRRGRTYTEFADDTSDLLIAFLRFDWDAVGEVIAREGAAAVTPGVAVSSAPESAGADPPADAAPNAGGGSTGLAAEVTRLGSGTVYRLGATGPNAYDCSGLVWRAMRNLGLYSGVRFTTHTWSVVAKKSGYSRVQSPVMRDDVLWWPGHMGVADSPTTLFHARSPRWGVNSSPIKDTTKSRGTSPQIWRKS